MKKLALLLCFLNLISCAHSQPDNAPGLAQAPPINPPRVDPPMPAPPTPDEIVAFKRAAFGKLINPSEKLDLSSPEACVRTFIWGLWNADFKTARQCVKGAQPYEKMVEMEEVHRKGIGQGPRGEIRILLNDIHSYILGETATVTLRTLIFADAAFPGFSGGSERFYLRRIENNWLILPYVKEFTLPVNEEIQIPPDDMIAKMAVTLADAEALKSDKFEDCQSNLKQIVLGVLMYSQDFDNRLPSQADWKNKIMVYVKAEQIFLCPGAKEDRQSYSFNDELENRLQDEIKVPAQTILLYEGKNKEFEFRHRNQTMTSVAFADGHVRAFTRQSLIQALENGSVRWKP